MTATTIRQDLAATVTALALPGVAVLAYEPPTVVSGTAVCISTATLGPTERGIRVRVYVSGYDPETSQATLDATVDAVDAALPSEPPRSDWTFGWVADANSDVAETVLTWPREDF